MMKRKKNNKWIVTTFILGLIIILITLIALSRSSLQNTKLTLAEKKWLENNKKEVVNVSIVNDLSIFSKNGEGVFFDFIDELSKSTDLSFNKISYTSSSDIVENDLYFHVVSQDKTNLINKNDMVFYQDYYVLLGNKEEKINNVKSIRNKKIGVLTNDLARVSYFLPSDATNNFNPYNTESDLTAAFEKGTLDYIAVPKNKYIEKILSDEYHVVYDITELKELYVLSVGKNSNRNLLQIVKKNYIVYENQRLEKTYNSALVDVFNTQKNVSEKAKADFLSKKYVYGYLDNEPYSSTINNKLIGLDSTYLNAFSKLTNASFTYKKYRSVSDLTKALNKGEVDIASNYYNYTGLSGDFVKTISPYNEEYVILTHKSKPGLVINSVKSLTGKEVITTNSSLSKYLQKEASIKVKAYDKVGALTSRMNKDSVVAIDSNVYDLYSDSDFSNYRVIYRDKVNLSYGYLINDKTENATFSDLLSNYIEIVNYKQMYNQAWKNYKMDSKEIGYGYLYLILALIVILLAWLLMRKKVKVKKKVKREETIRYVDPLTSLKNRHYLNKNFQKWEENAIYPQSIIIVNLNNLRHINDVYGHEEGDKLIKLAANVLIRNQLEQSDIIRTDGNEYMVYMVGYEENKVISYMRKLYKELKELPYGFGATLGYSMIEDDIKTIDDAINEAVLEIRTNREMNNKNK
ncbi:MAG: GGDEF domain-containing protein [Bacilli bacterium]